MANTETTLILLKPDAIQRGLCGEILARFERAGLRVLDLRQVRCTTALLASHYAELRTKNRRAFDRTTGYLRGQFVIAVRLSGPNAIAKTRALLGPTDPVTAPAGTIRGDFSADSTTLADEENRGTFNLVHAADSPASARRETRLWFGS